MSGEKKRRRRRSFDDEFKAEVVKRVLSGHRTAARVARELDLTETAVRAWVKQAKVDKAKAPGGALTSSEREELTQLRREVRELREDREILKKAAVGSIGQRNANRMRAAEVTVGRTWTTRAFGSREAGTLEPVEVCTVTQ